MTLDGQIFSLRPWRQEFGDPTDPAMLVGVPVTACVLRREDDSQVLVSLADRRFALTGAILAVGSARQLAHYLRQRAGRSTSAADRDWLRSAADTLARRLPEQSASAGEVPRS